MNIILHEVIKQTHHTHLQARLHKPNEHTYIVHNTQV